MSSDADNDFRAVSSVLYSAPCVVWRCAYFSSRPVDEPDNPTDGFSVQKIMERHVLKKIEPARAGSISSVGSVLFAFAGGDKANEA